MILKDKQIELKEIMGEVEYDCIRSFNDNVDKAYKESIMNRKNPQEFEKYFDCFVENLYTTLMSTQTSHNTQKIKIQIKKAYNK